MARLCTQGIGNGNQAVVKSNLGCVALYCNSLYLIGTEVLGCVNCTTGQCFDIGIHCTTTAFKALNRYGILLHLLHIALDAHLTTAHILGRNGVCTIGSNLTVGHFHLNPVGITLIVELLFGCHIVTILESEAILYETGSRLNLHLEGLLIACNIVYQIGFVGSHNNVTIELRSIYSNLVAVYIERNVYDTTTVGYDVGCTGRIDAVPVYLVTHTVESGSCTYGHGEFGHTGTDSVTVATCCTVALVPSVTYLHGAVAYHITVCSRSSVGIEVGVEEGIFTPINIYITAHPVTRVTESGLHLGTGLGRKDAACGVV